jgi:hypothetical protein
MFPPQARPHTRIIALTSDLIDLAGDGNAAIFLAQALFWWRVAGRKKFYKFNSPCDHKLYRTGDSWLEELRLKRTMFATARRRVAVKVHISCMDEITAAFNEGALIVYGTDENHLTWYLVNEQALQERSPAIFARFFEGATVGTSTLFKSPRSQPQVRPAPVDKLPSATPVIPTAISQCTPASSADAVMQHSPMQEPCIGIHTEITTQRAPETASKNSLQPPALKITPLPTDEGGGGIGVAAQKVTREIFTGLQERGVQDDPARLIARRAVRVGLGAVETLEMFDAHVLDAERANAASPVGVAVSRMVKNTQITPAPAWALAQVRRRNQEREWMVRQQGSGVGESVEYAEVVSAMAERGAEVEDSPAKTLWQKVLGDIKLQVTRATFEQCFNGTWLAKGEQGYVVHAHNPHTLEWLAHRLNHIVTKTLQRYAGVEVSVVYGVESD